ncbi:protein of unknown function [Micropruina glycogenica]|uniref:HTH araC/xylS-type domain-containing protein n=1 Tax=Micropruina glycogenica TaxID=75385 RepID=A0A2N9JFB6_9ACTN|nr:protein of unknown function [Micropruina glycogenica]
MQYEFGLSPRQLARIGRFERAQALAQAGMPLAETAHRAGFADQAGAGRRRPADLTRRRAAARWTLRGGDRRPRQHLQHRLLPRRVTTAGPVPTG